MTLRADVVTHLSVESRLLLGIECSTDECHQVAQRWAPHTPVCHHAKRQLYHSDPALLQKHYGVYEYLRHHRVVAPEEFEELVTQCFAENASDLGDLVSFLLTEPVSSSSSIFTLLYDWLLSYGTTLDLQQLENLVNHS